MQIKFQNQKIYQGGGWSFFDFFDFFKSKKKKSESINKTEENPPLSFNEKKELDLVENKELDLVKKKELLNQILKIEDDLLNNLLENLIKKNPNSNNVFESIYKEICNVILNYREFFYLNVDNFDIKTASIIEAIKNNTVIVEKTKDIVITVNKLKINCIENIVFAQNRINTLLKNNKFQELETIITKYFTLVYESIDTNIYSVVKEEKRNRKFKNSYILKKIIDEVSENNITRNIITLEKPQKDYNKFMKELYNIQKLLKLNILYNNNINDDTDNYIMLINCYIFVFKFQLAIYKQIPLNHDDLYFNKDIFGGETKPVNKDIVMHILNTLINIILYFTHISGTKESYIKDKTSYIVRYNNENYDLAKIQVDELNKKIIDDIIRYLPKNSINLKLFQKITN